MAGDAVVGAEHGPERERGVPQRHRDLDVLGEVEAEPAPLLGDRVAEEPHLGCLAPQVVRDRVGGQDLQLAWYDSLADELGDLFQDIGEDVVRDLGVSGVHDDDYRLRDCYLSNTK